MSAQIIDGKIVATAIKEALRPRIETLKKSGVTPGLAAVLVGDNPASETYVSSKGKACLSLGMYSEMIRKPKEMTQSDLVALVTKSER